MTPLSTGVVLGPVEAIPFGEGRAYETGGRMVAVFRLRSGALRAVPALCPHAGGPLADGQADENVLICPLHLNTWDLGTGCSTSGQADLEVLDVRAQDGQVVLFSNPAAPEPSRNPGSAAGIGTSSSAGRSPAAPPA